MIARASSIESARVESPRPLTRARLSAAGPLGTLLNEHRVILLTTDLLQSWALRVEHDQEVVRRELRVLIVLDAQRPARSEEHTSELQSRENLVCRLLLEKKKKQQITVKTHRQQTNI